MTNRATLKQLSQRVGISAKFGAVEVPDDWPAGSVGWKVTLRYQGRQFTTPFYQGPRAVSDPDAEQVLGCLVDEAWSVRGPPRGGAGGNPRTTLDPGGVPGSGPAGEVGGTRPGAAVGGE